MTEKDIIDILNLNWEEEGFFEKLRYPNQIDFKKGNTILNSLQTFNLKEEDTSINRELVRLLWYIPQFMTWQQERLAEKNEDEIMKSYVSISDKISNEVERILGYP